MSNQLYAGVVTRRYPEVADCLGLSQDLTEETIKTGCHPNGHCCH